MNYIKRVPILHAFLKSDFMKNRALSFKGIWNKLPFLIISKKQLKNRYDDIADHCVSFTLGEVEKVSKNNE